MRGAPGGRKSFETLTEHDEFMTQTQANVSAAVAVIIIIRVPVQGSVRRHFFKSNLPQVGRVDQALLVFSDFPPNTSRARKKKKKNRFSEGGERGKKKLDV